MHLNNNCEICGKTLHNETYMCRSCINSRRDVEKIFGKKIKKPFGSYKPKKLNGLNKIA